MVSCDGMHSIHLRSSGLRSFRRSFRRDNRNHYVIINSHSFVSDLALMILWSKPQTRWNWNTSRLRVWDCPTKHSSPETDCLQHCLNIAHSTTTEQAFMDFSPINTIPLCRVIDLGHWRVRGNHDDDRGNSLPEEFPSQHIIFLIPQVQSVSELVPQIVSELAQRLSGLRMGVDPHSPHFNDVWLADCPQSARSSRDEVLELIEMCRRACWGRVGTVVTRSYIRIIDGRFEPIDD